jgi:hypothetical protein
MAGSEGENGERCPGDRNKPALYEGNGMFHETINIEYYKQLFPVESSDSELQLGIKYQTNGTCIYGPCALAIYEQLLEIYVPSSARATAAIPTDAFLLARGEPPNPWMTKFGGVPLCKAGEGWPTGRKGEPLVFMAQINFCDSRDITGPLPGDILQIFSGDDLYFFWLSSDDVAQHEWVVLDPPDIECYAPYYGVIYRTVDLRNCDQYFQEFDPIPEEDVCYASHATVDSMKIGGLPNWLFGKATETSTEEDSAAFTFLCQLNSIFFSSDFPYSFVNESEGVKDGDENALMIADAGSLYLFLADDQSLQYVLQTT